MDHFDFGQKTSQVGSELGNGLQGNYMGRELGELLTVKTAVRPNIDRHSIFVDDPGEEIQFRLRHSPKKMFQASRYEKDVSVAASERG